MLWTLLSRSSKTYQYHIICPCRYPSTFCTTGNVLVDYDFSCLVDEILNFTIFTAFNLMPVKGYDTNSVLTFKKIGGNQELCQTDEIWLNWRVKNAREMPKEINRITSTQAVIPLCTGCRFPPLDEWFAETNTFGVLLYFSVKRISWKKNSHLVSEMLSNFDH